MVGRIEMRHGDLHAGASNSPCSYPRDAIDRMLIHHYCNSSYQRGKEKTIITKDAHKLSVRNLVAVVEMQCIVCRCTITATRRIMVARKTAKTKYSHKFVKVFVGESEMSVRNRNGGTHCTSATR